MVSDLDLAIHEKLSVITGNDAQAEITHLARRYLALRSEGVVIASGDWYKGPQVLTDEQLDAAADRLLEGGEIQC